MIIKKYYMLFCFLFSFISIQINAQENVNSYLKIAAKQNPQVQAAFSQYLAALEVIPQVGSLPDLQSSMGLFLKPMQLMGGNQVANIQLMQMFPWFGTLEASKSEAALMAKARFETFNSTKATVFYHVKISWYQLIKLDKEIALVKENIELLESLEKMALVKFQSPVSEISAPAMPTSNNEMKVSSGGAMANMGNTSNSTSPNQIAKNSFAQSMGTGMGSSKSGLQDVLRVKMEILEQKNRFAQLSDQRKTEEISFNVLLNRDLNISIVITEPLSPELLSVDNLVLADSILANNSMLVMLRSENESYQYMELKAKKMGMPMLGVGLNYMIIQPRSGNTSMMNGNDMMMPMVSVSIPIYRKKYVAMQNEARLMKEANNYQINGLENDLLLQHQQLIRKIDDAARRIVLYKEQENLARKTTELLLSDFSNTGSNYEEVLRMQLKILDYGFKYIEAVVDNNTAVANIEMILNAVKY